MIAAPAQVSTVPMREKRVKGSLSSKVAKAVLKTRPACSEIDQDGQTFGKLKEEFATHSLEGRQYWQRESCDLDRASDNIGEHKHEHTQL
jgi:hypothetical protein